MRLTLIALVCCFFVVTATDAQNTPGIASKPCVTCRNSCLQGRVNCISNACRTVRGTDNGPNACIGIPPGNNQQYTGMLKVCYANERACLDRCQAAACN